MKIGLFIIELVVSPWNRIQGREETPLKQLMYQQVASKRLKTMVLMTNHRVRPYIPETRRLNPRHLKQMLHRHASLFIKPDKGGGGVGAVKLLKRGRRKIELRTLNRHKVIDTGSLLFYLKKCLRQSCRSGQDCNQSLQRRGSD